MIPSPRSFDPPNLHDVERAARLSVAPMMERTDRHFRYFARQLSHQTLLYSEMVTTHALLHGDATRLLAFDPAERPLALQLGGDSPEALARCARIAEPLGYDEINLNVGCPSDKVQSGNFGACLMAQPNLVADCVRALREAVAMPITVKHRIGTDQIDSHDDLCRFVRCVAAAGCKRFIVHARIAVLSGLSPKQNRSVPPLRYPDVYRLKRDFPHLSVVINGGVRSLSEASDHLLHVDGVMIGRAAYDDPFLLAAADQAIFDAQTDGPIRGQVLERMRPYLERHLASGQELRHVTRHMIGLFAGHRGARQWRRACNMGDLDGLLAAANTILTAVPNRES